MRYLKIIFITLLMAVPTTYFTQSNNEIVKEIQGLMFENYIFLDKAEETNEHLDDLMKSNYFDSFTDPAEFAKALSVEMQKVTKDKHLNVAPPRPPRGPRGDSDFASRHLSNMLRFRSGGFGRLDLLDGNVGYVELKGFRREDIPKVDHVMSYFSTADAIIIDLRDNGGGSELGAYWSSYFLQENTELSGTYERRTDTATKLKTTAVRGVQRLDVPIFILTSERTFSAAEAFAYDLQSHQRATIIGEITGGGAHPVDFMRLPLGYGLIVPYAESVNPVTKSNWEGVGVQPDVEIGKEQALARAEELAKAAAAAYREGPFDELKSILSQDSILREDDGLVCELLELLLARNHLEDFMVNNMGYSYLDNQQLDAACVIFRCNVKIFPEAPNAHDSYAEALAMNGMNEEALFQYRQAFDLAERQNDRELERYRDTLKKFEESME